MGFKSHLFLFVGLVCLSIPQTIYAQGPPGEEEDPTPWTIEDPASNPTQSFEDTAKIEVSGTGGVEDDDVRIKLYRIITVAGEQINSYVTKIDDKVKANNKWVVEFSPSPKWATAGGDPDVYELEIWKKENGEWVKAGTPNVNILINPT